MSYCILMGGQICDGLIQPKNRSKGYIFLMEWGMWISM